MASFSKEVLCSNCGNRNSLSVDSTMNISEITIAGACSSCGGSIQATFEFVQGDGGRIEGKALREIEEDLIEPQFSENIDEIIEQ